jgi:hypothetical protein
MVMLVAIGITRKWVLAKMAHIPRVQPMSLAQHASYAKRSMRKLLRLIQIKIENCQRVKIGTPSSTGRYG